MTKARWVFLGSLLVGMSIGSITACGGEPRKCNASNCNGCCDFNDVCQEGDTEDACGKGGGLCFTCSGSNVCEANRCTSPDGGDTDAGADAGMDAGMDAGTGCNPACGFGEVCDPFDNTCVIACTWKTDCGAGGWCNTNTGLCEAAAPCDPNAQQPSGQCLYGEYCTTSGCMYVPAVDPATCENFLDHPALDWSPFTGSGPVIYSLTQEPQDTTWCTDTSTPKNVSVRVKAYDTANTFPSTVDGNQGFFYVKVDGTDHDAVPLVRPSSGYTVSLDGHQAEFRVNFCVPDTQDMLQVAAYFTNGNPACGEFEQP